MKPILLIFLWLLLPSCSVFSDLDKLRSEQQNSDTSSDSDTGTGTATDTDTNMDSATNTERSSDSHTEPDTSVNTETDCDTQTDTDTNTDTQTDTDTNTNTDTNIDTDTDTLSDTATTIDTATETDSGVDSSSDSDTGLGCQDMNWECGEGFNDVDVFINCSIPGCSGIGLWCNEHDCQECNTDTHCGDDCINCTETVETPICSTDGSTCVECNNDTDCKEGGSSPNPSPLGSCTPDNTCTCWVPDTDETTSCNDSTECPANYSCAQDLSGKNHYSCLRNCDMAQAASNGLTCEERNTATTPVLVWVPLSTCYAFYKFGKSCGASEECRISATLDDGLCQNFSGQEKCTYTCWDTANNDSLCPTWPADTDACIDATNTCNVE